MSRTRSVALSASALLLSAPLLLTGCGLGGSDSKSKDSPTSQSQSQSQSKSSQSTPSGSGSPTSTSQSGDTKPDQDAVKAGLVKYYTGQGVPQSAAETLAGCMVDKGYDKFSAKTLNALKDGKPAEVDPMDGAAFVAVSGQCAPSGAGLPSGLPTSLPTG